MHLIKDLHVVITGYCKHFVGDELVQRGDYRILRSDDDQVIISSELSAVILPGMTVEMAIVLRQRAAEGFFESDHSCPRCNYVNKKIFTTSGWVNWLVSSNFLGHDC